MFRTRLGIIFQRGAKVLRASSVTGLALLLAASPAFAVPLTIQFSGLDLSYGSNTISDAASASGGANNPADADPLDAMTFLVNGVQAGAILTSDIYADISIPDVTGLSNVDPSTVVFTPGNPGYFDLLIGTPTSAAQFLRLDTSEVTVTYINVTSTVHFVFGGALVAIDDQLLPYGLQIGDPVTVSFSSLVDNGAKTNSGDTVTGFLASGTGEVNGTYIPEPSTILLGALGVAGMLAGRRRS